MDGRSHSGCQALFLEKWEGLEALEVFCTISGW
jgi:hypothetical protein